MPSGVFSLFLLRSGEGNQMSFAKNNPTSSWTGERSVIMHTNKQQYAKAKITELGDWAGGAWNQLFKDGQ